MGGAELAPPLGEPGERTAAAQGVEVNKYEVKARSKVACIPIPTALRREMQAGSTPAWDDLLHIRG